MFLLRKIFYSVFCILLYNSPATLAQKLSDSRANTKTTILYQKLHQLSKKYILFGHQDALAYGVNWKYIPNQSDIKLIVNDYPAVYGWDIGKIEHNASKNLDGVPFDKMIDYIKESFKKGAINTISWHLDNPLTGKSSWDTAKNTVNSILQGGDKHELYLKWLDNVANFINKLRDENQQLIPILFRPFHEEAGNWFWWGQNTTSSTAYKELWKTTVNYLRNEKKLNNLILVFNTNDFKSENEFLRSYPGDEWVDMLSFDQYQYSIKDKEKFSLQMKTQLKIITKIAQKNQKLIAIAETGFEAIPDRNWWTKTLFPTIKDYPVSYVLVWRNAGKVKGMENLHYYAPYPGQISEQDFKKLYRNKRILFENQLNKEKIYLNK